MIPNRKQWTALSEARERRRVLEREMRHLEDDLRFVKNEMHELQGQIDQASDEVERLEQPSWEPEIEVDMSDESDDQC